MKNLFKTLMAVAVISVSVSSCKKGDDDPGLSLSSRTSRFAGEWKIDTQDETSTDVTTNNSGSTVTVDTDVNTSKITGNTFSSTTNSSSTAVGSTSSTSTLTGTVSEAGYKIEKDGTWTSKMVLKVTSQTDVAGGVTNTDAMDVTMTIESNGTWQFLGKNKSADLKNKEAVVLSTLKETTTTVDNSTSGSSPYSYTSTEVSTYGQNENTEVWTLSKLAKKEMVAEYVMDNNFSSTNTVTFGGTSTTTKNGPNSSKGSGKYTFKQD